MGQLIPLEGTPPGLAFTTRQPVLRRRLDANEFPSEGVKQLLDKGIVCGCTVPLIRHGKAVGTLGVASFRDHAARLTRLGIARGIRREKYSSGVAVREIQTLLQDKRYTDRATEIGTRVRKETGLVTACDLLSQATQRSNSENAVRRQMTSHGV